MNLFRVRLYVNVPGSLIIAGNSKKPIRKPPSSTKIEEPSMEGKAIPETEADSGNMTRSGAMSMWTLTNLGTFDFSGILFKDLKISYACVQERKLLLFSKRK